MYHDSETGRTKSFPICQGIEEIQHKENGRRQRRMRKKRRRQKRKQRRNKQQGQAQMLWGPDTANKWDEYLTPTTTMTREQ